MNLRDRLDPLAAATTAVVCASRGFQQVTIKIFGATLLHERVSPALAVALAFVAFGIWPVNRPRRRGTS
jgi:hypothetical protein